MPAPELQTDTDTARAFLDEITRGWDQLTEPCDIELRCLFPERTPLIARYSPDQTGIDMLLDDAAGMNRHGLNAYVVVNPVRATAPIRRDGRTSGAMDEDIVASFFFWADGDDEEAANSIRNFAGPKYTMAVTTGAVPYPRPHIYWRIKDGPHFDLAEWRTVQEGIAAVLSTDPTVVNASRIMRIPGFVNWPTVKKQQKGRVPEVSTFRMQYPDERPPVPFEQMQRAFAGASPKRQPLSVQATPSGGGFQIDTGNVPTLDRERLGIQAMQGQDWHNAVIRLVASYVGKGLSDGEIHALTQPLTLSGYTGEQTAREVQTAIDGARRKGWTPEPYASPVALQIATEVPAQPATSRLEWFDDIEPVLADSYVVKGVLSQGSMSVVYGPSNSGKTFFALDLAYHIAIGAAWRGHRVRQAAVLYLAAEGGRGVANRIAALKSAHGVCDVPLALRRAGLDLLHSQANLQELVELAQETHARLPDAPLMIVVDTLSRVIAGGDENSAADMTAFIRNIDAVREMTRAHVMIVHHTGKDTARGARGHSSLRAATDTEIEVGNNDGARAAMVTKQRDYPGSQTFAFSLKSVVLGNDQEGDEVNSCVVECQDEEEYRAATVQKKGLGGNQKLIADTFDQMLGDGLAKPNPGGTGMPESGKFWTVDIEELRRLARGKMVATDTRSAFNQAMRVLTADRGLFATGGNMVWRTDRRVTQ